MVRVPIAELEKRGTIRVAAGSGWQRYPELLEANKAFLDEVIELPHPRARHLLALGAKDFARGAAIAPQDVLPAYLRQKVAEKPTGDVVIFRNVINLKYFCLEGQRNAGNVPFILSNI